MNISTLLDFPAVVSLIDEKFLVGVGGGGEGGKGRLLNTVLYKDAPPWGPTHS